MMRFLSRLVANMIALSSVKLVDDSRGVQEIQVAILDDEDGDDRIPHAQPMGISFVPPEDAEVFLFRVGGTESNTFAMCAAARGQRPTKRSDGSTDVKPHEGGLYALGSYRVFLDDQGRVYVADDQATEPMLLGEVATTVFDNHGHPSPFGLTGLPTTTMSAAQSQSAFVA